MLTKFFVLPVMDRIGTGMSVHCFLMVSSLRSFGFSWLVHLTLIVQFKVTEAIFWSTDSKLSFVSQIYKGDLKLNYRPLLLIG